MNTSHLFNLVTEAWIPVIENGETQLYSLQEIFGKLASITRIEDPAPLNVIALYRLLLAIIYRAASESDDDEVIAGWYNDKQLPTEEIQAYLNKWQSSFDLFDAKNPFYQTAAYENKAKNIAQLYAEKASGTNKLLFDHTNEQAPLSITPAEAARLLIARQMLAIPEGAGYSPSPIGGTAVILVMGDNLAETLCLNLVPYKGRKMDIPVWENPKEPDKEQIILGPTHRYTWKSRHIRLEPTTIAGKTMVQQVHYGAASKLKTTDVFTPDPMLAYKVVDTKTGEKKPLSFRTQKALWRDFPSLIPNSDKELASRNVEHALAVYNMLGITKTLPVMILGASNDKAKFELWRTEYYILPPHLSQDTTKSIYSTVEKSLERAESAAKYLSGAVRVLIRHLLSKGDRDPHKDDVSRKFKTFPTLPMYWSYLEQKFPELLSKSDDPKGVHIARNFWLEEVKKAMLRAWETAEITAGDDAQALKAIHKSKSILHKALAEINTHIIPEETT